MNAHYTLSECDSNTQNVWMVSLSQYNNQHVWIELTAVPLLSYSQPGCIVNLVFSASVLCCMCWECACICCVACAVCWWWCWWLWCIVCDWWCCTNLSFRLFNINSNSATISDRIRPPIRMKKMPATFFSDSSLRDVSCFSPGSHWVFSNHHLLNSSVNSPLSINDNIAKLIGTLQWKWAKEWKKNIAINVFG